MSNQVIVTLTKTPSDTTIAAYTQLCQSSQSTELCANILLPFITYVAILGEASEELDPAKLDGPIVKELINLSNGQPVQLPPYLPLSCLENWFKGQIGVDTKIEINYGKSPATMLAVN